MRTDHETSSSYPTPGPAAVLSPPAALANDPPAPSAAVRGGAVPVVVFLGGEKWGVLVAELGGVAFILASRLNLSR